ncbi:MAG: sigma-70 family RNA polymerase sigma factor [Anaerolineae bacterium]|nr:sigma-70 family RNA polymerase sigma factor [Anaerolineae bacterium]
MVDDAFAGEAELLRGLRAGKPEAYRQLLELHSANVYNVAYKLLGDEQEAEDVLQETFLSAFEAIDGFEGRSKLSTWLYRIAYNASLMRLRKRSRMTSFSLDVPPPGADPDGEGSYVPRHLVDWSSVPDDQLLTAEARDVMDLAIAELPETLRATFILRDIQGLSGSETAEILGISVPTVKTRLHRARLWLRDRLSDYFEEGTRGVRAAA